MTTLPKPIRLPYVEQGDPGGVPVLMLHGWSDSWRSFEPVLPHLPAGLRAIVPTQRGHGDAERPVDGYAPGDFAADSVALLDSLEIERAVVVGHSMGAWIAERIALDHPERVLGVLLVGAIGPVDGNPAAPELQEIVNGFEDPVDPDFVREFQLSTVERPLAPGQLDVFVAESLKLPARGRGVPARRPVRGAGGDRRADAGDLGRSRRDRDARRAGPPRRLDPARAAEGLRGHRPRRAMGGDRALRRRGRLVRASGRVMSDLRGQTALLTGATGGLGPATARALANEGVRLALSARGEGALRELARPGTPVPARRRGARPGMTRKVAILALAIAFGGAVPAAAHHPGPAADVASAKGIPVTLRDCLLTAAFAPRPAAPLDFGMPFYGPDPLVGVWGLACDRSRVAGRPAGRLVLSLVGVPVGLTAPDAVPLANNFAHRLLWLHTSSRRLAVAARRAGLRASVVRARYRHSPQGRVPYSGRLAVPGSHAIAVSASLEDPTNPHDHANVFERRGGAALAMTIDDAFDRFCLSPGQGCSASLRAERGSPLARLLGATSAPVRAAFDHDELRRVDLTLG